MLAEQLQHHVNTDLSANYKALLLAIVRDSYITTDHALTAVWRSPVLKPNPYVSKGTRPYTPKYTDEQMQYVDQGRKDGRTWKELGAEFGITSGGMYDAWSRWRTQR